MKRITGILLGAAMAAGPTAGLLAGQTETKKVLTLDGARMVAAAAEAEARRLGAGGAVAVVDDGGHLLHLIRLDGTFAAASNISIEKARSAANFRRPTSVFEEAIKNGRTSLVANGELLPLQGGVPIVVDGQVVGAVGVAGAATAQQDEDIAKVAAALAPSAGAMNGVTYIQSSKVAAAFAKGAPLFEGPEYKVHASRREAPGQAEVHMKDTDIIYVLDGAATFVTGGMVLDGRSTEPEEVRGRAIESGEPLKLAKGDVVIVPAGTPHWFKEVRGPFVYHVVKAR